MTAKFIHIRECDEDGELLQTGGATIIYTVSDELSAIFVNLSRCSTNDQFCRKTGREVAAQRLFKDGPYETLILKHPISETILWWFITEFNYCLIRDGNGRWMSTFEPAEDDETLTMIHILPDGTYSPPYEEDIPDAEFELEETLTS